MRRSIQFLSVKPPQNSEQSTGEVDTSDQETPTPQAEPQFFPDSEGHVLKTATAQIPILNVSAGQNEFFPNEPQPSTSFQRPPDLYLLHANQTQLQTKIKTTGARDRANSANAAYPRTRAERSTTETRYTFRRKAHSDGDR